MAKRYARRLPSRGAYSFTPARRNALRKAAIISAQKRKRNRRRVAVGVASTVAVGAITGAAIYRHKASGSKLAFRTIENPARAHVGHSTSPIRSGAQHRGVPLYETQHHLHAIGPKIGGRRISGELTYKHRTIEGNRQIVRNMIAQEDRNKHPVTGRRVRVDREAIPHYGYTRTGKKKVTKLHWPHLTEEQSREQNAILRTKAGRKRG